MISFTCPCGKTLHAHDEQAAERMPCPECGRVHVIPRGEGAQATAPPLREQRTESVRPGSDVPGAPATTSGLAVAGLLLGVVSLIVGFLWGPLPSVSFGVPALLLGALGLWAVLSSRGRKKGAGLAITGVVTGLLGLVGLPVATYFLHEETDRIRSSNNLKIIGLSMYEYNDANGCLPPAAICDPSGKPLLSWRVLILPFVGRYIGAANLYEKFKLDEPWDGPNNSKLLSQMPKCYALPGNLTDPPGYTHYRVFVGNGAAFDPPQGGGGMGGLTRGISLLQFRDGASNTILVVEAGEAVPWTKPDELDFDPKAPLPPLGGRFRGGFQAAMADASVHWVGSNVSEQTLRAAITRAGGEALGPDW